MLKSMTTFQLLWVIAGAIIGWTVPEILHGMFKLRFPTVFNVGFAFVGALITYTILIHK